MHRQILWTKMEKIFGSGIWMHEKYSLSVRIFGHSGISSKHTMLTGTRINIRHQLIISISLYTVSLVDQTILLVERLALEIRNYEVPHSFKLLIVVLY